MISLARGFGGALALAVLLVGGPVGGAEKARRPARLEPYWLGVGSARSTAPASGLRALHPSLGGRVFVRGATFVMGSTAAEMADAMRLCAREVYAAACAEFRTWSPAQVIRAEGYAHEVEVSSFLIDKTEVTVEAYGRCVATGHCAPPSFPSGDPSYDRPTLPVTHVRWEDARDYCRFAGGRLPTEAEWELAAKGTGDRVFPWGDLYNPHLANHGAFADDTTDGSDGFVGLAPVGSFPDGRTKDGVYDMAGNAGEWVADFYDRDEEGFGYPRKKEIDPQGATYGPYGHVVRGGSFRDAGFMLRTTARRASSYATREIGFRCVAPVPGGRPVGPTG